MLRILTIKKEDEALLTVKQKEFSGSVAYLGDFSNQLNYELLTGISKTIPRKIIE